MNLEIVNVISQKDLKKFIMLPWSIYNGNPYWVPPLIKDMKETLNRKKNPLFAQGNGEIFLAKHSNKIVGRIMAGIDTALNQKKNANMGYISLFESIDDYEVAKVLFDAAIGWLKTKGINIVRGPVSPSGADSDDFKGLLINAFDSPPMLMNSYNPPYYEGFFEKYGFEKDNDLFAYYLDANSTFTDNPSKAIQYAMKRYKFRVDTLNLKNLDGEIKALKHVLDVAVPDEWPDLIAPSIEEVTEMARKLVTFADPDIIFIARSGDEPIGFGIALPDYNKVLKHMNGRLTPLSALKFLIYKKKIDSVRFFVMFVVPAFRKKGVSYAIYYHTFLNGIKKGYIWGEGSTIGENNLRMRADIESFGGKKYKTYRMYKKDI